MTTAERLLKELGESSRVLSCRVESHRIEWNASGCLFTLTCLWCRGVSSRRLTSFLTLATHEAVSEHHQPGFGALLESACLQFRS